MNMGANKRKIMTGTELAGWGVPLLAMYANLSSEPVLQNHDHGELFEICYLKRGMQKYFIGNEEYNLRGGDVFITFPNEIHSSGDNPQSRGCLYWIHIDSTSSCLLGLDKDSSDTLIKYLYSIKNRKFRIRDDVASGLINACEMIEKGEKLEIIVARAMLVEFLYELINSENCQENRNIVSDPIAEAKIYIDENIKEQLSLASVADRVGFSLSHFKYKFTKETGMTPGEYIMQKKIYDSVSLLPDRSLTYIAYEYNFSSPQHYSKNFKAVTGMTPKEYRNKLKNRTK
ncbi:MAG: helix-turn-helix transcriptional regulator [Clostridia bacterium]|nr:helix-turn-helix transcriptional regulator [Clostridia bacterium]